MILHAAAKINLTLDVTGRRPDGYHDVCMVMQSISLYDEIRMEKDPAPGIALETVVTSETDAGALASGPDNLAWRAAALMRETYGIREGVRIRLCKNIPMAAGLAGGSTDAAAVMIGMNALFGLGIPAGELAAAGTRLGADIPFCVLGGTKLAEGIGEILSDLPAMPDCVIAVAVPALKVATGGVYQALDACGEYAHPDTGAMKAALQDGSFAQLAGSLGNVLELVTAQRHPEIGAIKDSFIRNGAAGALMSGSGPSVYGLFERKQMAELACSELKTQGLADRTFICRPCGGVYISEGGQQHGC